MNFVNNFSSNNFGPSGQVVEKKVDITSNTPIDINIGSSISVEFHLSESNFGIFSTQESEINKFNFDFQNNTLSLKQKDNTTTFGKSKLDVFLTKNMLKKVNLGTSSKLQLLSSEVLSESSDLHFVSSTDINITLTTKCVINNLIIGSSSKCNITSDKPNNIIKNVKLQSSGKLQIQNLSSIND
jgi:hypothetical protein